MLQLRSLVTASGQLVLSLAHVDVPSPKPHEVLVKVGAAPINPSDLILLFGLADMSTAKIVGAGEATVVTADIPERARASVAGRVGEPMPVGNEGAGEVVAAGSSAAAQSLVGKLVGIVGGATYAQYRCVAAEQCLMLPPGATAAQGASSFVNPLTALGMVETMKREGHSALAHTAAASSLGQMLLRICTQDRIGLVNVVRKEEQVALLKAAGATHVCNTSSPSFTTELDDAIAEAGATIAFDAIGGGRLAGQLLGSMERALNRKATAYSRYGSATHKQVYIYGGLDSAPTELVRNFGLAWGLGGWLLTPFLQKAGAEAVAKLKARVAAELYTTFATTYASEVSLVELLSADVIAAIAKPTTGGKYLIRPNGR
ncbi:zinc-binding dehydrogenase [soil metagenome]